jgi:hypothetical protein
MNWTNTLKACVQAQVPVILWGPPGVGKTARVAELAEEMGLPLEVVVLSLRDPTDVAGLPVVTNDGVVLSPPAWAKRLAKAGKGILFLDEFSCAAPSLQAAALRILSERVVGDTPLPDGVAIVLAANPADQAAGGFDLSAPAANRFLHLYVTAEAAEWATWAAGKSREHALVAGFISRRPELLCKVPNDAESAGKAWPSPRSWDIGARAVLAGVPRDVAYPAAVGDGAALEFLTWVKESDLPDPEEILADPESATFPKRGDLINAVMLAVASAVASNPTPERWSAAWRYIGRSPVFDVVVPAARTLVAIRKKVPSLPLPLEAAKLGDVL